jgi:hypothetical protein
LSGAWFNPDTVGQGFFVDVLPDTDLVFMSWFTYDTSPPGEDATARVGDPGHRWVTAQGPFEGNTAELAVFLTRGGLFDDPAAVENVPAGSITLTFDDCTMGTVDYDFADAEVSGSVPITRLANDNVDVCQLMDALPNASARKSVSRAVTAKTSSPISRVTASSANCKMNPAHNGAWFNPETAGQGYFVDVLPDTDLVFMSWFTYDTSPPGEDAMAQVGDPGHRWVTAQGPFEGNTAELAVFLTRGGLFDDPAPVENVPAGSITLTFDDCATGTVDYDFTDSEVSGSVPIARLANDNVSLCEMLCNDIALEQEGTQQAVIGLSGGTLDVADSRDNILTIDFPQDILTGSREHLVTATPLSQLTVLPTGGTPVTGLSWLTGPGEMIAPARLRILSAEAQHYEDLAAFAMDPGGGNLHYVPLVVGEDNGVVLELPVDFEGIWGLVVATADAMESWPPPDNPPEARYVQEMAVILKRDLESGLLVENTPIHALASRPRVSVTPETATAVAESTEMFLPKLKSWFDEVVDPALASAKDGCDVAADLVKTSSKWVEYLQATGLEDHPDLSGRLDTLEAAMETLVSSSEEDLGSMDQACANEPDPCKQREIMKEAFACAQVGQFLGRETSPSLACSDVPAYLRVEPPNSNNKCKSESIDFISRVFNAGGQPAPVAQEDLQWSSSAPQVLKIDPETGKAETLEAGTALVKAQSKVCGDLLEGTAYVKIEGIPDLKGTWSVVGSETVQGCEFDEDNGTFGASGNATVTSQVGSGNANSESFSGGGSAPGLGEQFQGTVQCGGAISGTGSYTEMTQCGEETCTTTGTSTFEGTLIGNTVKLDTTAQDMSGDTCTSQGWARATKTP